MQRPKLDENIRILEGLAASGLRSIRYALEVSAHSVSTATGYDNDLCCPGKLIIHVI